MAGKKVQIKMDMPSDPLNIEIKKEKKDLKSHVCRCGKSFPRPRQLMEHIKVVHLQLKDYKCRYCGTAFPNNSKLAFHVKSVHMKMKDHKCSRCDTAFVTRSLLRRHERSVHLLLKDYTCKDCGQPFSTNSNMHAHIRNVHLKMKPHKCYKCDAAFATGSRLKRHEKRDHSKVRFDHKNNTFLLMRKSKMVHKKLEVNDKFSKKVDTQENLDPLKGHGKLEMMEEC